MFEHKFLNLFYVIDVHTGKTLTTSRPLMCSIRHTSQKIEDKLINIFVFWNKIYILSQRKMRSNIHQLSLLKPANLGVKFGEVILPMKYTKC